MHENRLFAGYPTLEEWATVADPTHPIYATRRAVPVASYGCDGPTVFDLGVIVAQPDERTIVHYCWIKSSCLTMLFGEPFDSQGERRKQCQADVWQFVQDWLSEHGFILRQAAFDLPTGLRHFEGRARFLAWNPATQRYYRTDNPPQRPGGNCKPDVPALSSNGEGARAIPTLSVLIEVWQGLVQAVYSDAPRLRVEVADRDGLDTDTLLLNAMSVQPMENLPEDIRRRRQPCEEAPHA